MFQGFAGFDLKDRERNHAGAEDYRSTVYKPQLSACLKGKLNTNINGILTGP